MANKLSRPPKEKGPKFDPEKSYEWKPDDEFILTGNEFSLLYNVLRQQVPEAKNTIASFNILQNIFELGIKEGTITEVKDQKLIEEEKQKQSKIIEL